MPKSRALNQRWSILFGVSPSWRPAERLTMVAMVVALGCAEGAASDGPGLTRAGGAGASPTAVSSGGVPSTVSTAGRPPDAEGLAPVDADLPSTDALVPVPDASAPPACLEFSEPRSVGNIELAELDQLSGLVASRTQPGVLFAHEDSTGAPTLYALETSGRALATFTLAAAPSTDWEDIAAGTGAGGESLLFIGDIGDNAIRNGGAPRDEIQVIRMPEPLVATGQAFVEATLPSFDVLRFRYPSGVHEAETLLVDPKSGDLLIITRSPSGDSRVFRASGATPPDTLTALEEVGNIAFAPSGQGALATAGDFSPNGDRVIIRTYTDVYLWAAPAGASPRAIFAAEPRVTPWAVAPQGEAISFSADGRGWLAAGEQEPTLYGADEACPR